MPFATWFGRLRQHVAELADWNEGEWVALFPRLDEDIEATVRSAEPAAPDLNLSVLTWLREHAPADLVARRLRWLEPEPRPGLVAVEAMNDLGVAYVDLPAAVLERLVREELVTPVERDEDP